MHANRDCADWPGTNVANRLAALRKCEATIWSPQAEPLVYLALQLSFIMQPVAEGQQRGVLLAYRPIGQIPAFVFLINDRKWGNQTARCQRLADIGELSDSDS